jgi:Cdc6-like AAA superfamily ATPase
MYQTFAQPVGASNIPPVSLQERQNRQRMLERVRAIWIDNVLANSFYHETLRELGIPQPSIGTAQPWRLLLWNHALPLPSRAVRAHITPVFDHAQQALLLLGDAGTGKTTLLLELARDLLQRAEKDETQPIPVIFNLSSWDCQPLDAWLASELQVRYQIPRTVAQDWISSRCILPLLDDMDSLAGKMRNECIKAINRYIQGQSKSPYVVCCRRDAYEAQPARLDLRVTAIVQPFDSQQIDDSLSSAGPPLEALRVALQHDPVLREIASVPQMLNMMVLAYKDATHEELPRSGDREARQKEILARYVDQMLTRKRTREAFTRQQSRHWLAWQARHQQKRKQAVFQLEMLQLNWLPGWARFFYMVSSMAIIVFPGIFGASWLLGFIQATLLKEHIYDIPSSILLYAIFYVGANIAMSYWRNRNRKDTWNITTGSWSWERAQLHLRGARILGGICAFISVMLGSIIGINSGEGPESILKWAFFGLGLGQIIWFAVILLAFIKNGEVTDVVHSYRKKRPDAAIWTAACKGSWAALIAGPAGGLSMISFFWLLMMATTGVPQSGFLDLLAGLLVILTIGLLSALVRGWETFLAHFSLRFLLKIANIAPLRYVAFLEYAVACKILQRVDSGYIFMNRNLQEYLARGE